MTKVVNFGCRLNNFEGKKIEELIPQQDNIIVINSCAVTNETERQVRQTIRRARKENPDAKLVMTGCAAQISPDDYKTMPEVDYVIDNINKLKQKTWDEILQDQQTIPFLEGGARAIGCLAAPVCQHLLDDCRHLRTREHRLPR